MITITDNGTPAADIGGVVNPNNQDTYEMGDDQNRAFVQK